MTRRSAFAYVVVILSLAIGSESRGQVIEPLLEQRVAASDPNDLLPVIVTLSAKKDVKAVVSPDMTKKQRRAKVVAELRNYAATTQAPIIDEMRNLGAINIKRLWIVNSIAAHVPAGAIDDVAAIPGVQSIQLDTTMNAPALEPGTGVTPEWNIDAIGAPELWNLGYRGQGVVVASLDTGVELEHPDLLPRWRGGTNSWFDPYDATESPFDLAGTSTGHGTHVMGLIVGGDAGGTAIGVAPEAKWIAAKIFDTNGDAPRSIIHLGFQWLLDPDGNSATNDAADVVNASFGFDSPGCDLEFEPDIAVLKLAAIAFVAAAGNSGPASNTSVSPANNPSSFAVGSVDAASSIAADSSRGPSACDGTIFPDVAAPGVDVDTADVFSLGDPVYFTVSGTSFAAPHVTGAMALLLSASPDLTPEQLELALQQSALDIGAVGPDNDTGYGSIDVLEAFNRLTASADADGDGFVASLDCNDKDPSIYPGAIETKFDGIDQDCNGYDLTIKIAKAIYNTRYDLLLVEASSRLGKNAKLTLVGYGPMKWSRLLRRWLIVVRPAGGNPGSVAVSGIEGTEVATVRPVTAQAALAQ